MTNEEMQRTMEFIAEQQAQFAASIQRAEEQRIRDTPRLTRMEDAFLALTQLAQQTDERLDAMAHSQEVLSHLIQNSDERLERLEAQRIQDNERVNRLEDSHQRMEDSHQVLIQLAQKMDVRLERLEQPGG